MFQSYTPAHTHRLVFMHLPFIALCYCLFFKIPLFCHFFPSFLLLFLLLSVKCGIYKLCLALPCL